MKPLFTLLFVTAIVTAMAQEEQVFSVQKPAAVAEVEKIQGIFCGDFYGDGRPCFYFDSLGGVGYFVGPKNTKFIEDNANNFYDYNPYSLVGDSISFFNSDTSHPTVNSQQITYYTISRYYGVVSSSRLILSLKETIIGLENTPWLTITPRAYSNKVFNRVR